MIRKIFMNTEVVTWILFITNGIQFYYILCAFMKRRIKSIFAGAFLYAGICMTMRMVSAQFEGALYGFAATMVILLQVVVLYPLFYVKKWYYAWIIEFIVMLTMIITQVPTIWLAELITGTNVIEEINGSDFDLNYVIATALNCMVYMIFILIVYILVFYIKYSASKKLLSAAFFVGLYQMAVTLLFYMYCRESSESAVYGGVIFVAVSIATDMAILICVENRLKKALVEKEWEVLSNQRKKEYERYEKIKEEIDMLRMERHEYANQIYLIQNLIDKNEDVEEIKILVGNLKEIRRPDNYDK